MPEPAALTARPAPPPDDRVRAAGGGLLRDALAARAEVPLTPSGSDAEDLRLLGRELLVGEDALGVQRRRASGARPWLSSDGGAAGAWGAPAAGLLLVVLRLLLRRPTSRPGGGAPGRPRPTPCRPPLRCGPRRGRNRLCAFSCRLSSLVLSRRRPRGPLPTARRGSCRPRAPRHRGSAAASANSAAQRSSQIMSAAEEFGSIASAACSMSSGVSRPPASPPTSRNGFSSSTSSISTALTLPSASFEMNSRSRSRIDALVDEVRQRGASEPLNWLPGKPKIMYSAGAGSSSAPLCRGVHYDLTRTEHRVRHP